MACGRAVLIRLSEIRSAYLTAELTCLPVSNAEHAELMSGFTRGESTVGGSTPGCSCQMK